MSGLRPNELIIGDHNWQQHVDAVVDGEHKSKGLIPRDWKRHPQGSYSRGTAFDMPLIPRSEWSERIRDMVATKSRLSDIRLKGNNGQPIPSRDQNGRGYCWNHSGTSDVLLIRARDNQPYVDLSAFMIGCLVKNYRDEGGWGAQGLDFIIEHGVPSSQFWPQRSVSRSNDTPEMRANAKLHQVSEGWMDMADPQYSRDLTFDQLMTALLCRIPGVGDYNWWGHSVGVADPVDGNEEKDTFRMESGKLATVPEFDLIWGVNTDVAGFATRIWNSWGDSWGDQGMGVLTGSKCQTDGCTAPRVSDGSTI
jgi:hypothetical protein